METSIAKLQVMGKSFTYEAAGRGDVVLFIHGSGFSGAMWMPFARALEARVRSVMVDLLGYGRSQAVRHGEVVDDSFDLALLKQVIERESSGAPVHLVGHSYGAVLAAKLALQDRALVRSLALVEPALFGPLRAERPADCVGELESLFGDGKMLDPAFGATEAWAARLYDYWTGKGAFALLTPRQKELQLEGSQKAFCEVREAALDVQPFARYSALPKPLLLVGGERSTACASRIMSRLGHVSGAVVHVVPAATHFLPITHGPELLEMLIRMWLIPESQVTKAHVGAV
ncbi:MAG: alpha/beta hydrolase [Myxococcales bacterium]|nr:alpha/beta hydrolase [Myxococcales bacterium]